MITTGGTVGLAEAIINGHVLLEIFLWQSCMISFFFYDTCQRKMQLQQSTLFIVAGFNHNR